LYLPQAFKTLTGQNSFKKTVTLGLCVQWITLFLAKTSLLIPFKIDSGETRPIEILLEKTLTCLQELIFIICYFYYSSGLLLILFELRVIFCLSLKSQILKVLKSRAGLLDFQTFDLKVLL
jgi:hypothetical protein